MVGRKLIHKDVFLLCDVGWRNIVVRVNQNNERKKVKRECLLLVVVAELREEGEHSPEVVVMDGCLSKWWFIMWEEEKEIFLQ